MGVIVSCPRCMEAWTYEAGQLGACAACGAELPWFVREQARRALLRARPLLINVFAMFLGFFAFVGTVILVVTVLGSGPYTINGVATSKAAFLRTIAPFVPIVLTAGVTAWALWREKPWGRPLFLGFYVVVGLASVMAPVLMGDGVPGQARPGTGDVVGGLVVVGLLVGFFSWYLYGKQAVVAYYRALKE